MTSEMNINDEKLRNDLGWNATLQRELDDIATVAR